MKNNKAHSKIQQTKRHLVDQLILILVPIARVCMYVGDNLDAGDVGKL